MAARMTREQKRELQGRIHEIFKQAPEGTVLRLSEIAEALGMTGPELGKMLPIRGKVVRVGFGKYAAWTPTARDAAPTLKRVVAHSLDGTKLVDEQITRVGATKTPAFRLIHVLGAGEVLLQDEDKNVWKATLL